jgi:GNAT superfamily N-acetyltransferase
MNEIKFVINDIPPIDLIVNLYKRLNWGHHNYPSLLEKAYLNSEFVVSAYTQVGDLVGLGRAISDNAFTVYFPDLLVRPDWQGKGIGKQIMLLMMNEYKNFHNQVLIAEDNKAREFYLGCGFIQENSAMSITKSFQEADCE